MTRLSEYIENKADWITTDMYNKVLDPWDIAEYHVEASHYYRYGLIKGLALGCFCLVIIGLCALVNYLVLGNIQVDDLYRSLLFVLGLAFGVIIGCSAIVDKFKRKLERGY